MYSHRNVVWRKQQVKVLSEASWCRTSQGYQDDTKMISMRPQAKRPNGSILYTIQIYSMCHW